VSLFFGYYEDVKGYRLLQSHSNEIIIRKYVKFDENILACEPKLTFAPYSAYKPSSVFVPYSVPSLVSYSPLDNDTEDGNPPPPAHLPPYESIEHEFSPTPSLPRWVGST
jgi:hypothetical protein